MLFRSVIKEMKNADYFVSYQKIMELARSVVLVGPGRGSGGGSLVNYVLYVTDLDPIKWNLPFARFLSVHRCLDPNVLVLKADGTTSSLADLCVGDHVMTHDGTSRLVTFKTSSKHKKTYVIKVNGSTFRCSGNHEWLVKGPDGNPMKKRTVDLSVNDVMYTYKKGIDNG